jgi:transposase
MNPTLESVLLLGGVFVVIIAVAHGLKGRSTPAPLSVTCPRCGVAQIGIRKPANLRQFLWGGYTCPGCGAELDRWGKPVKP